SISSNNWMNIIIDNWCCFIYWCYLNDSWMASNVFEQQQQLISSNGNQIESKDGKEIDDGSSTGQSSSWSAS
ncbi:hypothetical protein RDWZM_007455, partial [Blomia tropicalis]